MGGRRSCPYCRYTGSHDRVRHGKSRGRCVFVCIASGPSLTEADCELVRRWREEDQQDEVRRVVVINTTFKLAPWADYLYACDADWWQRYHEEAHAVFRGELWTQDEKAQSLLGMHRVRGARRPGLCTEPGTIHYGGNSGYQAMNLAFHFGASQMILLGYDMQQTGGKSHWHGDHPQGLSKSSPLADWVRQFRSLAEDLKTQGVRVWNASRQTALDCFVKAPLESALGVTFIEGMRGLGDCIYQRAFVKALPGTVYLATPWPELYEDLPNVRFVRMDTRLRTQAENISRQEADRWLPRPRNAKEIHVSYGTNTFKRGSILDAMRQCFGVDPFEFDLPVFGECPVQTDKPIALVRPVTIRSEWRADARNPLPEYVSMAAERLKAAGYYVVSLAHLSPPEEVLVGSAPVADITLHHGELDIRQLMALVQHARVIVGGVGWIVPASLAAKKKCLIIAAGLGAHNAPEKILPRTGAEDITFLLPDQYCRCDQMRHSCKKTISGIEGKIDTWIASCSLQS